MSETYRNTRKTETTTITTPSENFNISTNFNYKEYRSTKVVMLNAHGWEDYSSTFRISNIKELKELVDALIEHIENVEKEVL